MPAFLAATDCSSHYEWVQAATDEPVMAFACRTIAILCQWTESTIRADQLTHVLLHELGHHHDRMTTRRRRDSCRGEAFAERYAIRYANLIWDRFVNAFGRP